MAIANDKAAVVLADEKRPNAQYNLATTIPITPYYTEKETSNTRAFGDILIVQNADLPEGDFPLPRGQTNEYTNHYDKCIT